MATCQQIISRAFRMAKIISLGEEPSATELDDAMGVLQSIYQRMADTCLGAKEAIYETDDYEPLEGEMVVCDGIVTLPTEYDDGAIRKPKDLAAIAYRDSTTSDTFRFYVSDRGTWVRLDNLASTDTAPFADRNQEGLAALVASEIADTFGGEITPMIARKASRFQSQMQPVDTTPNEYY